MSVRLASCATRGREDSNWRCTDGSTTSATVCGEIWASVSRRSTNFLRVSRQRSQQGQMDSLPKRQATKEDELLRDYKQEDITTKSKPNRSDTAAREPMRTLRVIGAAAALLAVLGIVVLVICLLIRLPRF